MDRNEQQTTSKKSKKAAAQKNAAAALDLGDQAALNRRAERFHREHELERQKSLRINSGQNTPKSNSPGAHLLDRMWRADSPSTLGSNSDDPEADPVCPLFYVVSFTDNFSQNVPNWDRHTIVGTNTELFKDYLRLTSVRSVLSTPADAERSF